MSAFKLASFGVAGVVGLGLLADSITIVQPRQRAIGVTFGNKGPVLHEGMHLVLPLATTVNRFDLTLNVSDNPGVLLKTKDSQTIYFDVIGHYCLTAGCLDPEKAGNVPDAEIDKQYYTFKDTSYDAVYKSFLLEAASDAIGKRAITDISSNISTIAQEIKDAVVKKLADAGYTSLHTQDVLLRNYKMEPAAEQFANSVANDMQRATQLRIQSVNLDAEEANATKRGQVTANELTATSEGIGEAINSVAAKTGISKELAADVVRAQIVTGKWNGQSLTAPAIFPGPQTPVSVLAAPRPIAAPAPVAPR